MSIVAATPESILRAAEILKAGGLVALPTETVYGLGANALDGRAVARIFAAKGRPQFNPLIVHVADIAAVKALVEWNAFADAASIFWPGPLTLILPRRAGCGVSELCSAGLPTLAVRVPGHKTAQALLRATGVPVAAPSANASGSISPTTPLRVQESLGNAVDMILADGASTVGLESTVLDLSGDAPVILRPGAVTAEQLSEALGLTVGYDLAAHDGESPKSPGQLLRHYAPKRPLRLNAVDVAPGEALLGFGPLRFMGVRGGGAASDMAETMLRNLSAEGDLNEAAANLFRMMDELDRTEHAGIAVMHVPERGIGVAINDPAAASGGKSNWCKLDYFSNFLPTYIVIPA